MRSILFSSAFIISMLSAFFPLSADVTDKTTGESFPEVVSFDYKGANYTLSLTGVATRKKLVVSVYSVASYLQQGAKVDNGDKFELLLSDANAKQLTLKWVRDVEAKKVQEGFQESLKSALGDEAFQAHSNEVSSFIALFSADVKKGDQHVLRSVPDGTVLVELNGKAVGSVTNKEFARGVWGIWFQEKSVVDRNKLVSQLN